MGCPSKPGSAGGSQNYPTGTNPDRVGPYEGNPKAAKSNDGKIPVETTGIKPKKVSSKVNEALVLPTCMNLNPRSIYNKTTEFITFIKEKQIHCVF